MDVFKAHIEKEKGNQNPRKTTDETRNTYPLSITGDFPTIREATQWLIAEAMKRAEGNQSIASRMLGISQQALSKRLKK